MIAQTPTPSDLNLLAPALVAAFAARYPKLPPLQTELTAMGLGTPYQGPQQVLLVWCDKWQDANGPLVQTVGNEFCMMCAVQPITAPPTFNVDGLAINIATAFAYQAYNAAAANDPYVPFNNFWVRPASLSPTPTPTTAAGPLVL